MTRYGSGILLLVGLLAVACGGGGNDATLESGDSGIVGFHDFSAGSDKSFGIFVCSTGGEVTLESVEAISQAGDIEMLGAVIHESNTGFVGADNDFPPSVLDGTEIVEIEGAVVTTSCEQASPETLTQIVVGVSRTGPTGGTIEGVRINHENGALDVEEFVIVLCGDEMQRCEDFAPEG